MVGETPGRHTGILFGFNYKTRCDRNDSSRYTLPEVLLELLVALNSVAGPQVLTHLVVGCPITMFAINQGLYSPVPCGAGFQSVDNQFPRLAVGLLFAPGLR